MWRPTSQSRHTPSSNTGYGDVYVVHRQLICIPVLLFMLLSPHTAQYFRKVKFPGLPLQLLPHLERNTPSINKQTCVCVHAAAFDFVLTTCLS